MTLSAGTMLGPYEVDSPLGAGGMGDVYRARDTRLHRVVAVKVLRSGIVSNSNLRTRFEREARAISHLSHPHICALYDVGSQDGLEYLVMEYFEGKTLAEQIRRGPLVLSQTVRYGAQIAEALHHAHRNGITHRDLKPGNVMLTTTGAKLLDFGLAKLAERSPPSFDESAPETLEHLTGEGAIVGTVQYMSPEQIQGNPVDHRSDIFSLGIVLYEMATGQRPFPATTPANLMAAILTADPVPLRLLQPKAPPALERIILTALEKNPDERWQAAQDVGRQLRWLAESSSEQEPSEIPTKRKRDPIVAAQIAAAAVVAALLTWSGTRFLSPPAVRSLPARLLLVPPKGTLQISSHEGPTFALSPDGRTLCFVGMQGPVPVLFLRALDSTAIRKLERTEGAFSPFWSPDGSSIGYSAGGKLWKTAAAGGIPEAICDVPGRGVNASWGGNMILFSDRNARTGIFRVPATGGNPVEVTTVTKSEWRHGWPHVLSDGRHFLYLRFKANSVDRELVLAPIDEPKFSVLLRNVSHAQQLSDDRIAYVRDGKLFLQHFDADRGTVVGGASVVGDDVRYFYLSASAQFAAANGVVVFNTETSTGRLTLIDRRNNVIRVLDDHNLIGDGISISPDGKRAVATLTTRATGMGDLWIYDLTRGLKDRFTRQPGLEQTPVWTPDGRSIIYSDASGGLRPHLVRHALASSTTVDLLPRSPVDFEFGGSLPRDGSVLYFTRFVENGDIMRLDMATNVLTPLLATNSTEADPQVSPDGKWLAYASDVSGFPEVYMLNLAAKDVERIRISHDGGLNPRWRSDGRELFYLSIQGVVMNVVPAASGDWNDRRVTELFRAPTDATTFAVTPDGQTFLIAQQTRGELDDAFTVVLGDEDTERPQP